jgi:UPF0271 protein
MTDQRLSIDLNCDIGESFGAYTIGDDRALLEQVTSANIACGFHAGDPGIMRTTVELARDKNVAIGAHPGLPDRVAFGRRRWDLSPQDAYDLVLYQIGALAGFVRSAKATLTHVKPHGALYNMAANDSALAAAIAKAVFDFDPDLVLYGLAGSELIAAGQSNRLRTAREAFADRTYERDGTLTPREIPSAVIQDAEQAVRQAVSIVRNQTVVTRDGAEISIQAETICIHGDRANAADFARAIRQALVATGVSVESMALMRPL